MFENIIGHKNAINYLKKLKGAERLPHAFLFSGQDSIGKRTIAELFVKMLNNKEELTPDFFYPIYPKLEKTDLISIDIIREIKRFLFLKNDVNFKAVIIDDVHKMRNEAANALLKILEEPPQKTLIILITSKPDLILPTIISRCQFLRFYAPSKNETIDYFKKIWKRDMDLEKVVNIFSSKIGFVSDLNLNDELWIKFSKVVSLYRKLRGGSVLGGLVGFKEVFSDSDFNDGLFFEILIAFYRWELKNNPNLYLDFKPVFDTIHYYFKSPNINKDLLANKIIFS